MLNPTSMPGAMLTFVVSCNDIRTSVSRERERNVENNACKWGSYPSSDPPSRGNSQFLATINKTVCLPANSQARQIMTRSDFIQQYDQRNLFTIDSEAMVRADSVPMQNAIREICSQPGFDLHLKNTLLRLDELESLGRTRELVLKDLAHGGNYKAEIKEGSEGSKMVNISWSKKWSGWW